MARDGVAGDMKEMFDCLGRIAEDGPVGNRRLRDELGWRQNGRYARARDTLVAAQVVQVLPGGRGGRLVRIADEIPDGDRLDVATERELCIRLVAPLHDVLREGDPEDCEDDVLHEDVAIDMTADLGGAHTGGSYSRPDLMGAIRRRFSGFDALEVHSFEVKPYWNIDRSAVFESRAQQALGISTHAWVVLYLPSDNVALRPNARTEVAVARKRLFRIKKDAGEVGLGLIECRHLGPGGLDVKSYPKRHAADPERLDTFLTSAAPTLLSRIGIEPATVTL